MAYCTIVKYTRLLDINIYCIHTFVEFIYIYIDITVVGLISGCSALHYWIILDIQKGYIGQTRSYWILKGYTGRNIVGSTYWTIWILKGQLTFIFFIEIRKISFIKTRLWICLWVRHRRFYEKIHIYIDNNMSKH